VDFNEAQSVKADLSAKLDEMWNRIEELRHKRDEAEGLLLALIAGGFEPSPVHETHAGLRALVDALQNVADGVHGTAQRALNI
jgi:hypothetical protein